MKYSSHKTYYNAEGAEVPSATTVIKLLNKPFLMKWSNIMGFKRKKIEDILEESSMLGIAVHYAIEQMLLEKKFPDDFMKHLKRDVVMRHLGHFLTWRKSKEELIVDFVEGEFSSEKYGGTIDLFAKVDGKHTIVDFKTSKKFYSTMFLQLGAYVQLLEEQGKTVDQVMIVRVNIDRCSEKIMTREQIEPYVKTFNQLITLFHLWYELNEEDGWGDILGK